MVDWSVCDDACGFVVAGAFTGAAVVVGVVEVSGFDVCMLVVVVVEVGATGGACVDVDVEDGGGTVGLEDEDEDEVEDVAGSRSRMETESVCLDSVGAGLCLCFCKRCASHLLSLQDRLTPFVLDVLTYQARCQRQHQPQQ